MKKLFNILAALIITAPLLMATRCTAAPPPNTDLGCEIECFVHVNYVDKNGVKIHFGTNGYPDTVSFAICKDWVDTKSGKSLAEHNRDHFRLPVRYGDTTHRHILAAPARDGLMHPNVKGKLKSYFASRPSLTYDDIEVELHYNTPDNAYIKLIRINGEVKWDRSSFAEGKIPKDIVIGVYFDPSRLE